MNPINSSYIHFVESRITVATKPFYKVVNKEEADDNVNVWQNVMLIAGSDLKELGVIIPVEYINSFFDTRTDPILYKYCNTHKFEHIFLFEALISDC